MKISKFLLSIAATLVFTAGIANAGSHATTLTIATVNNGDMIRM